MLVCFESLLILLSFYLAQGEPDKYHKEHFWLHLKMYKRHGWLCPEFRIWVHPGRKTQVLSLLSYQYFFLQHSRHSVNKILFFIEIFCDS